jgi:hypothetical protein
MPQDKRSGEEGNAYGHECGKQIASALGALKLNPASNECLLNGERVVIKCAHKITNSVGVTYETLKRIRAVVGAFEEKDGSYSILILPADDYILHMSETRSRGPSAGKVGIVSKSVFHQHGRRLPSVRIQRAAKSASA